MLGGLGNKVSDEKMNWDDGYCFEKGGSVSRGTRGGDVGSLSQGCDLPIQVAINYIIEPEIGE